jgi:propionyl-CoA carboxylase alpha chain
MSTVRAASMASSARPLEPPENWVVRINGVDHAVAVAHESATVDGRDLSVDLDWSPGERRVAAVIDGEELTAGVNRLRGGWTLSTRGARHDIRSLPRSIADLARHMIEKAPPDHSKHLLSPMPGLLTQLHVQLGDKVEAGQPLAVVEAMKMENILRAAKSGVVSRVAVAQGESLAVDAVILEFD